jgi:hypothetical protein
MEQETKNPSHEEKLKAIIEKAIRKDHNPGNPEEQARILIKYDSVAYFIFSHDFAKAFWPEPQHSAGIDGTVTIGWQNHIQQLALTPPEERIDYLYKFVNE